MSATVVSRLFQLAHQPPSQTVRRVAAEVATAKAAKPIAPTPVKAHLGTKLNITV